jgi:hypothetical protein
VNVVEQVCSMKAMSVLLMGSWLSDLLLVPKKDHVGEKTDVPAGSSSGACSTNELRDILRGVMKQMVLSAMNLSSLRQASSLQELERALNVLYRVAVQSLAEDQTGMKVTKGG